MGQLLMRKNVRSFEIASLERNGILYFSSSDLFFHLIISFGAAVGAANFETFFFVVYFSGTNLFAHSSSFQRKLKC